MIESDTRVTRTVSGADKASYPRLLNLGSGPDYRAEWLNVDADPDADADEYIDLNQQEWPLPSDHFVRIDAHHVFEHLDDVTHAMCEATRLLAPDGYLEVRMPLGRDRTTDPTHRQDNMWTYDTPEFYSQEHRRSWGPDLPLVLVGRRVRGWFVGPMQVLNPVMPLLSERWPRLMECEAHAGELIVRFRHDG